MAEHEITVSDALLSNLLSGGKEGLGRAGGEYAEPGAGGAGGGAARGGPVRAFRVPDWVSERVSYPSALQPGGAIDVAGAAVSGRFVFDGDLPALPAFRAGSGIGADGDGGQRGLDPEGVEDYGGVVRGVVFDVDGVAPVRGAGRPGAGMERAIWSDFLGITKWKNRLKCHSTR